jgi:hypothetical protein
VQNTADLAQSAERAFDSCKTEEQFLKEQLPSDDADQLVLDFKVDTKQQLIQHATTSNQPSQAVPHYSGAANPPPQSQSGATGKGCLNAAKVLGSSVDGYLKEAVLEKMRNRGCFQ